MLNFFLILSGKLISFISKVFNKGSGSTWPGHIALSLNKNFIKEIQKKSSLNIILVVGTNGKTTTSKILTTILQEAGKSILQNTSGANLLNGIASSLILNTSITGTIHADFAIFEVDENTLPLVLQEITPFAIIALNLFRDQLDRYGELDSIAGKWKKSLERLSSQTKVILNADDPLIAYLGKNIPAKIIYFGLNEAGVAKTQHASDSIYCPQCGNKLSFQTYYYAHLGIWKCTQCTLQRPQPSVSTSFYPLSGTYNKYNTLAAVTLAQKIKISHDAIQSALQKVTPAFGRQEKILIRGKQVQIFLAKNPVSFNQSLSAIHALAAKYVLFVLNDRIPDGRDVSWIWDIDIEDYYNAFENIFVSGDRVYDMALRLEYANKSQKLKVKSFEKLEEAIRESLQVLHENETLYILPTYSAMLEVR